MLNKLLVANVPRRASRTEIEKLFSQAGKVEAVEFVSLEALPEKKRANRCRPYLQESV